MEEEKEGCEYGELKCETMTPIGIEMTPNEALMLYSISIDFLNRGCIVRIGCKHIAFESPNYALKEIQEYIADPIGMQRKWKDILN